jgi:CRP-like cAMP-binding protein
VITYYAEDITTRFARSASAQRSAGLLRRYFDLRGIPTELLKKAFAHLEYTHTTDNVLLDLQFPPIFNTTLRTQCYQDSVAQSLGTGFEPAVVRSLCQRLTPRVYCPIAVPKSGPVPEFIVTMDHPGDSMYFLLSGHVSVIIQSTTVYDPSDTLAILSATTDPANTPLFGELSMVLQTRRTASVLCVDPVQLLRLSHQDWLHIFDGFPDLKHKLERTLLKRALQDYHLDPRTQHAIQEHAATVPHASERDYKTQSENKQSSKKELT